MEFLKIDRTKLITQSEYARLKGLSKQRVNQLVKAKEIKTIEIKGATLIHLD
jgi:predicted transcriptional regulator